MAADQAAFSVQSPWSPGSLPNSMSSSVPSSPFCMSSPLRGPGPLTIPSTPPAPPSPSSSLLSRMNFSLSLDQHRTQCLNGGADCDATCTWSKTLPPKSFEVPSFSVKVFLGGVPWDITEPMLAHELRQFGMVRVERTVSKQPGLPPPKGYAYIIMGCEKQVVALLKSCRFNCGGGSWYFKMSSKTMKAKDVQVIPWMTSDSNWVCSPRQKLDPEKTVFVGGLHGTWSASVLATVMNNLFDGVVFVGIFTDKFKYPIGSARVTFNNKQSFSKAINSRFVTIKINQFAKEVELLPYLQDSPCVVCMVKLGPYFCRESPCFGYFCRSCWQCFHAQGKRASHKHLTRSTKSVLS
ncbi:cytoplasmic polyadenylation element-binding protein 1 isoform X3 [Frankliniella occidentalis]|uniref:Cytoplasmic polyadenylation element-binding protein 1 isoform X3 n=1 Tax=Frankliniella occidentalis TaxID=133901 RepID=A0A6J1TD00_FRAOC|nr:cytoplasmic polyadenylation element-binding protein 1 isoform X3 [Frankliniella occidentalis]